ncbi:MAG: helix-hairpin-helix domain-containing protein [Candidatus Paceibacterota bacterium]
MFRAITHTLIISSFIFLGGAGVHADHAININTAGAERLQELTGIGEVISGRIVTYRQDNGSFGTLDEITKVKGIGPATFEDIRDHITIHGSSGGGAGGAVGDTRSTNEPVEESNQNEEFEESSGSSSSGGGTDEYESKLPSPLAVTVDVSPPVIVAGAPVMFTAEARIEEGEANTASFTWSLGDGARVQGAPVTYTYARAGTYVVVVNAETRSKEARLKKTITVHEGNISITDVSAPPDGSITLQNNDAQEYLLTGWQLASGAQTYTVPEDTFIAGRGSITLPAAVTKLQTFPGEGVALRYPNGTIADRYSDRTQEHRPVVDSSAGRVAGAHTGEQASPPSNTVVRGSDDFESNADEPDEITRGTSSGTAVPLAHTSTGFLRLWPWLAGLLGVLALGILGFVAAPPGDGFLSESEETTDGVSAADADEYEIIDSIQTNK